MTKTGLPIAQTKKEANIEKQIDDVGPSEFGCEYATVEEKYALLDKMRGEDRADEAKRSLRHLIFCQVSLLEIRAASPTVER